MGFWVVHGEDRPGAPYAGARPKTKRDTGRRGAPADPATRPLGAHPLVWLEALGNIHAGHVYRLTAVSKTWGNIIRGEPLLFSNIILRGSAVTDAALSRLLHLANGKLISLHVSYCKELTHNGFYLLRDQPLLQSVKLMGCSGVNGRIGFCLYPIGSPPRLLPLSLFLAGCSINPGHVKYLEHKCAAGLDVGVCQNCGTVADKRDGLLCCDRCGAARCRRVARLGSVLKGPYCDDTTRCGACGLVLCGQCDDRRHKCACCDDVFCEGCVGKSDAATGQACAFCSEVEG